MRLKRKCSTLIALLLILAGCVLRFAMPGHDLLGYTLWGIAVLVFLFPRLHRVGRTVLGVLVCAGLIVFTIFEIPVVRDAHTDTDAHPDTIIVLGAGVNGSTPSLSMCNRLDAALAYLNANPAATVIVSGGQGPGEDITEAKAMADYLTAHGIDSARIVQEDRSRTTRENLENSFAILRARGGDPADGVGIVTSEYHLYRAKRMARSRHRRRNHSAVHAHQLLHPRGRRRRVYAAGRHALLRGALWKKSTYTTGTRPSSP